MTGNDIDSIVDTVGAIVNNFREEILELTDSQEALELSTNFTQLFLHLFDELAEAGSAWADYNSDPVSVKCEPQKM